MGTNNRTKVDKAISLICLWGCIIMCFVFILFRIHGWWLLIPCFLLFFAWGFRMDAQRTQVGKWKRFRVSSEKRQKHFQKALDRFVMRYGNPSETFVLNKARYDGVVDAILVFDKAKHLVIDGLDYEICDILDCQLEANDYKEEYAVNITVKGFGRQSVRLELGNDKQKAQEAASLITRIIQKS